MPGHKGRGLLGVESLDLTEISGADSLYSANGIIYESEKNAASLFGSAHSFYSTEGSTLAIKAMLALVTSERDGGARNTVLAGRNAHKAFILAAALLDFDVSWMYGSSEHPCECIITPNEVETAICEMNVPPKAVYITSPDYLGRVADIAGIANVCKKYSIPLLVDNAHGAYLKFLSPSCHPIDLGAAMCCDSAHKTLPVLTGGAYLHISSDYSDKYLASARSRMAIFASTSPSYLTLASLDLCNDYIENKYPNRLAKSIEKIEKLKADLSKIGFTPEKTEPQKLVISAIRFGYTGGELSDVLREFKIEPEFSDREYIVLMFTPENDDADYERIFSAFSSLKIKPALSECGYKFKKCKKKALLSIREAVFSQSERVKSCDAVGRIAASPSVSCPPAVPIVISGEVIETIDTELLDYYGIDFVEVVK